MSLLKITSLLIFIALSGLSVKAQSDTAVTENLRVNGCCKFSENWSLSLNAGGQMLFNQDAAETPIENRFTPHVAFAVNKWFTPFVGTRLQVQAFQMNTAAFAGGIFLADPQSTLLGFGSNNPVRQYSTISPNGSYWYKIFYLNPHLDLQMNISNMIKGGYSELDKFDIIASVGMGYMRIFEKNGVPAANMMSSNFAVMGQFRLTDKINLHLEVQSAVLPDMFEGRLVGKNHECNLAASIGISYKLGNYGFEKNENIVTTIDSVFIENTITDTIYIDKIITDTVVVNKPDYSNLLLASIAFPLNKAVPKYDNEMFYINIAKFLKQNSTLKIVLDGYADKETGNQKFNQKLAKDRAETVRKILIDNYNIASDRIELNPIGPNSKAYDKNKLNRVVIIRVKE